MGNNMFGDMRRAGMKVGLSQSKLKTAMYDILLQLQVGTKQIKEVIVYHLGIYGQMASSREINDAWNSIKKKAAKEFPDKFILDGRGVLLWNDGTSKRIDTNISASNIKKLTSIAEDEDSNVDQIVTKLIAFYTNTKKRIQRHKDS